MLNAVKQVKFSNTASKHFVRFASTAEIEKHMATTYTRPEMTLVKGRGSRLWDSEGKEYIDFTAGIAVTALGHSDPQIADVMNEQSRKLVHSSNLYHNEWAPKLSAALVNATIDSGAMQSAAKVFLCNSGTEANEAAIKFARKACVSTPGKSEIIAFKGGFHGRTYGALSATCNPKYQAPFGPMVPNFSYASINDKKSLSMITEKTCGVIIEPIQGEGGVNACTPEFLKSLRAKCTEMGAVLIYDEIQCGLGRTGDLWAHTFAGKAAQPDIITMAKALGNGFPVGATMVSEKINDALKVGDHGTTYGGNPLASRIGLHVLERINSPFIRNNVMARSEQIKKRVANWEKKYSIVSGIRGRGLLLGIQLTDSPAKIVELARTHGLLVITCGTNTLRLVPPLNITEEDCNAGLDILERAIDFSLD